MGNETSWVEEKVREVMDWRGILTKEELTGRVERAIRETIARCADDAIVAAVREAVILEKLRYDNGGIWGGPIPEHGAVKVYVAEVTALVRAGLAPIRKLAQP